jgi:glycosyltransferase involved in cell wall biosynthesis
MLKVLHCIPGMGGGGAERQLAHLAKPLIARGWEVHVALVAGGPNLPRLQSSGAIVHGLNSMTSYDPRLAWQLASLIRRIKPDVVQVWFVQMEVLAGLVSTLFHVPWILSERSSILAYPATWKNRLRVAIARRADAIVSNSAGGDAYWSERAGPDVQRFVIPNGIPMEEIEGAPAGVPAALPLQAGQRLVLSIGRFGPEKNVDRVFVAFRQIVERPGTIGVMCGDGPLRAEICERIAQGGLDGRIFAPGYVAEIWPLLTRADVVVAAGLFEGRPNSVLEAMAAGRPLVVSDIPAHREILDEASALWVDAGDAAAIADAVKNVLDDPAGAERRAVAARSRVAQWSMAAAAAKYDSVYRLVLSRRRTRLARAAS